MLYLVDIFELFLSLQLFLSFLLAFSFINKNDNYNNDYTWVLRIPDPDTPVSLQIVIKRYNKIPVKLEHIAEV